MNKDNQNTSTIQRCPHDVENPYALINRDLIRDKSISPNCRWLLIYLLSMQNGWQLKVNQIYEHVKEFIGRTRVYRLIDEAIEAGYIKKVTSRKQNLFQEVVYYVSETPKFKKSFPLSSFGNAGAEDTRSRDDLRSNNSSSYEEDKNKHIKRESEASASPPLQCFGPSKRVKLTQEQHESLVKEFGEEKVQEKIEALDEYADLKPREFKKYGKHSIVLRKWIRNDLKKSAMQPKREDSELNDCQKENLKLNHELVNELKLDYPHECATMTIYYKAYLLKSKTPYFDISLLIDHKEFCRFLGKHLKMNILEVRFPHGKV